MRNRLLAIVFLAGSTLFSGCADTSSHAQAIFMLLDTSGTYTKEIHKAQAIINYLLGTLQPGDSLAIARIDSGSFSEKDIIAKQTFDDRPSVANAQKRKFQDQINSFVNSVRSSSYTDITGGVLQAVEYLNETAAGNQVVLIFSDLKEDLQKGQIRDFPISMDGVQVVALNVTKLRSDNVDPREYKERLDYWQDRVMAGNGQWRVINDLDRVEKILRN